MEQAINQYGYIRRVILKLHTTGLLSEDDTIFALQSVEDDACVIPDDLTELFKVILAAIGK